MTNFVDLWLICCGIAGILIAVMESRRSQPRTMVLATIAWMVVLSGVVLNNQKIDANRAVMQEVMSALQAHNLIEDDTRRGRVLRDDFVPLPRLPDETGEAEK